MITDVRVGDAYVGVTVGEQARQSVGVMLGVSGFGVSVIVEVGVTVGDWQKFKSVTSPVIPGVVR